MKKFFKQLNRFLYLKDYELFINRKVQEKDHELKYVQDLLLSSRGKGDKLYNDGEINAYVNHIESVRKKEKANEERLHNILSDDYLRRNKDK